MLLLKISCCVVIHHRRSAARRQQQQHEKARDAPPTAGTNLRVVFGGSKSRLACDREGTEVVLKDTFLRKLNSGFLYPSWRHFCVAANLALPTTDGPQTSTNPRLLLALLERPYLTTSYIAPETLFVTFAKTLLERQTMTTAEEVRT